MKDSTNKILGNHIGTFSSGRFGNLYAYLGVILLSASILSALYAGVMADALRPLFILVSIICLVIGIIIIFRWKKYSGSYLSVYDNGFVFNIFGKNKVILWSKVDYISVLHDRSNLHGVIGPQHVVLKFKIKGGSKYRLTNGIYPEIRELAIDMQNIMSKQRMPQILRDIKNGETISFGIIKVNKDGIVRWIRTLKWGDFDGLEETDYSTANRVLILKKGHKIAWSRPYQFQITNLYMFYALVNLMSNNKLQDEVMFGRLSDQEKSKKVR
jgi:hypothetical protein